MVINNMKSNSKNKTTFAIFMAILAAILYGLSSPISKLLVVEIPPTLMASLLYLGAGCGMLIVKIVKGFCREEQVEAKLTRNEMPFVILMIILDILAPVFLMLGLSMTTASNASLLNNFEIVSTSLIALFIFKEAVGRRMWISITLITLSSIILSVEDISSLTFSIGSIFVLAACISWGLENNCTRMLSLKDPLEIVIIKGFGSGFGSLIISLVLREYSINILYILIALILGFVAFGLSIYFYILAQRYLGAARTSAYYAAAPFIGVFISWLVLHEQITLSFIVALLIMLIGTYFAVSEDHGHSHIHENVIHEHKHNHIDVHHSHQHDSEVFGEHSHPHAHETLEHKHPHTPDLHHRHMH